jgi:hypothetical protein
MNRTGCFIAKAVIQSTTFRFNPLIVAPFIGWCGCCDIFTDTFLLKRTDKSSVTSECLAGRVKHRRTVFTCENMKTLSHLALVR